MITLDGSMGEGGGQILRTALALSMATSQPFRIDNIRAGRPKPGLMRQHLTAVAAATQICGAQASGVEMGAQWLEFRPGAIQPGQYHFAVGTAGSATLVLQTVLPALLLANGQSSVELEGGTHNPYAPPFDFLEKCFLPVINAMGPRVTARLERPGFYPAGGGKFRVTIDPVKKLAPIHFTEPEKIVRRSGRVLIAGMPNTVAQRQLEVLGRRTGWDASCFTIESLPESAGPGNAVVLELQSDQLTEILTGFGQKGVSSEAVIEQLGGQMRSYITAKVPVGHYLADQLLLPMALAGGGSFLTIPLSRHSKTNIEVIQKFLSIPIHVLAPRDRIALVRIGTPPPI